MGVRENPSMADMALIMPLPNKPQYIRATAKLKESARSHPSICMPRNPSRHPSVFPALAQMISNQYPPRPSIFPKWSRATIQFHPAHSDAMFVSLSSSLLGMERRKRYRIQSLNALKSRLFHSGVFAVDRVCDKVGWEVWLCSGE